MVEIPTNKPVIRQDHTDVVYKTQAGKYRAIVEQVKQCHAKGQPVLVGTVSIEKSEILSKRAPLLNRLKDKMNRKIRESGLDATTRYELHMRLNGMREHEKICHGDFNPSNVIVTPDGDWYVIDWSHVTQGNASADAARTYLLFCLNGKEDVAEQYLQIFCEKNDIAKQYVRSWMPIVAASQLGKGKESEREILLRWANVVQYE